MDSEARHELSLLEAVEQNGHVTQRGLSAKLGMALGLTNIYVKRLVRKGYIKCVNVQANRMRYLITPTGIAEKTRLTYEFMEYSLELFRQSRNHLRAMLQPCAANPSLRIAIFGTGEAAELAYLCLKEMGVDPVAVFGTAGDAAFFHLPVHSIGDHASVPFDAIIVATLDDPATRIAMLAQQGIDRDRLVLLRQPIGEVDPI
jgi:DNA-binding MarR family transcriptional regulator